jgi:hypothetical protein
MLANQHDGAVKKGAVQLSAVQDDLPLQRCVVCGMVK